MNIAIASDHGGFELKQNILKHYDQYHWVDLGTTSGESVDYPDFAQKIANAIRSHEADVGILICGTGIGISIAANRCKGIRAALLYSEEAARLAKQHNNANVMVFGGRTMSVNDVIKRIDTFLNSEYESGRHQRRLDKLENMELKSMDFSQSLAEEDNAIYEIIGKELRRQQEQVELIASENIVSRAVMEAQGSVLTNKYAEGYPSHRYYCGCEYIDEIEVLAQERAKKLFGAQYVNVQPHSGSQANMAVYTALMQAGDTLMGMSLDAGGHLTHGARVSLSGKMFHAVQYGVRAEDGLIDYDAAEQLALESRPKVIVAGGSAYPRQIDFARFRKIADKVGAYLMVDMAHFAGLVAGDVHPNPLQYADVVTTTTHKTLRGPRGGMILTNDAALYKKINSAVFPGTQGGPLEHVIAAKAVCFAEDLTPQFKQYARQIIVNAKVLGETLVKRGLNLVSGGTDTHLLLVDLRPKMLTGDVVTTALEKAHITCNKNAIPFDPQPPTVTSGVRLGTPAGTTRGFKEKEFEYIGNCIGDVIDALAADNADEVIAQTQKKIAALCRDFPIYK